MIPFSIAGIQMNISMERENITAMGHKLDVVMARFPWVQMVVFSELAPFVPAPYHAQPTGGPSWESANPVRETPQRRHGWVLGSRRTVHKGTVVLGQRYT